MNTEALLIIDMQSGSFESARRHDADGVVARINRLSEAFRRLEKPVIHIQHDGTKENCFFPGTAEWEILPSLVRADSDPVFAKTANDAFWRTSLDAWLRQRGIGTLYVTGCATDYCVNATIHGALTRDYTLVVAGDAHTTADRPLLSAVQLIAFHNWLWADLTPTGGKIMVKPTESILLELSGTGDAAHRKG